MFAQNSAECHISLIELENSKRFLLLLSFLCWALLRVVMSWHGYSIYGVHDEAKDKAFELEMSWVCEESNREHQRVSFLFFVPFSTFRILCWSEFHTSYYFWIIWYFWCPNFWLGIGLLHIQLEGFLALLRMCCIFFIAKYWQLIISMQVPADLLSEAKAAAKAAQDEDMDAD